MQKKTWVTLLITGIAILGVTLLIGLVIGALRQSQNEGQVGDVPEDIRSLIANPPTIDCVALATQYNLPVVDGKVVLTYIPNAVDAEDPNARNRSDAVNISAIPAELDRILASHCTQPEQAGMSGVALVAHNPVLAELNPELFTQFQNTTAKEYADKVFSGEISYEEATKAMTQLAGFLTIFNSSYQTDLLTEWNYHAEPGVLTLEADVRPIVKNPDQYTGDFWRFDVIDKRGNVLCLADIKSFGINLGVGHDTTGGDQRIAGFACDTPPTPEVPTSTPTPTATPTPECVGECVVVVVPDCPPGQIQNGYGKCVVPKDNAVGGYVYAPVTPVTTPPVVIVVIPDDDTTDESDESDGTVSD